VTIPNFLPQKIVNFTFFVSSGARFNKKYLRLGQIKKAPRHEARDPQNQKKLMLSPSWSG
jgi:hypothetical protein